MWRRRGRDVHYGLAGTVYVFAPLEFDPDDRDPDGGGGADAADARSAIEGGFDGKSDEGLEFGGRHPAAFDENGDGGRGEVGKDIERNSAQRVAAPDEEGGGQEDYRGAVAKGPANEAVKHGEAP